MNALTAGLVAEFSSPEAVAALPGLLADIERTSHAVCHMVTVDLPLILLLPVAILAGAGMT